MPALSLKRRQLLPASIVTATLVIALWAFSSVFTSPAARACDRMYREARTLADSAVVDGTVPSGDYRTLEPRSCGNIRGASRWPARH